MIVALLLSSTAWANGQNTHVWIALSAAEQVQDPQLHALLAEHQDSLRNGSMFPDGGYAVNHPYGEAGHWEPLQDRYRDWIREGMDPKGDDAAPHVAFYMGMAAHGMADQSFDAFYFSASRELDADYGWADGDSFDEASDAIWVSLTGAQTAPQRWVPQVMPALYQEESIEVDADTLESGQRLVITALELVGLLGQNPQVVQDYQAQFPWGGVNLDQPFAGAPADEARITAAYLDSLWVDLNLGDQPLSVVATVPAAGSYDWPMQSADVRARLGLVFSKGLHSDSVQAQDITLTHESGAEVPVLVSLFYGQSSHVLHVLPQQDLELGSYTLELAAGVAAVDGRTLPQPFVAYFSTAPAPLDTGVAGEPQGCGGCGAGGSLPVGGVAALGLLILIARRTRETGIG